MFLHKQNMLYLCGKSVSHFGTWEVHNIRPFIWSQESREFFKWFVIVVLSWRRCISSVKGEIEWKGGLVWNSPTTPRTPRDGLRPGDEAGGSSSLLLLLLSVVRSPLPWCRHATLFPRRLWGGALRDDIKKACPEGKGKSRYSQDWNVWQIIDKQSSLIKIKPFLGCRYYWFKTILKHF